MDIQNGYINQIKENHGKGRRYFITTFGCQMNAHDSEKLAGLLVQMGYTAGTSERDADVIVYNTCCVRENAENKVYGKLGYLKHLKAAKPHMKIALCGCMMQQDAVVDKLQNVYRHVDVIFGTYNLDRFPELLCAAYESNGMITDVWREHKEVAEDLPMVRENPYKAGVNVMYGCNNFCTYCIVPYVRGRERSRKPSDILNEIKKAADGGAKEILLLGQNVNSYGAGLDAPISFAQLLAKATEIDGVERVRFMTSHPKDCSDELIDVVRGNPKACSHIHLPFQSGSTEVLRRMNRKYTKEDYLHLTQKVQEQIPEVSLTTDIIVGFPGETEADFQDTMDVVRQVRFQGAFTFLYSKRSGTPAAAMDGQIPEDVAHERFNRLLEVVNEIVYERNRAQEKRAVRVLAETFDEARGVITGRADDNSIVHCAGDACDLGMMMDVRITEGKPFYLLGEKIH